MTAQDSRSRPAEPRPAATTVLLREGGAGVEILAIRRHEELAFMGGLWVFPGGSLAPADTSAEVLARIPDESRVHCTRLTSLHGTPLEPQQCLGLAIAACRETFEETGVLLATTPAGEPATSALTARVQNQRQSIAARPELFARLLHEENLYLRIERLVYWAHWITPSSVSRRFDTRFFLAAVPPDQVAVIDNTETIDHAWMTPAALVAAGLAGSVRLSPPTLYNVMELQSTLRRCGSLPLLFSEQAGRQVPPILPKIVQQEAPAMVLPWDPFYRNFLGEGAPEHLEYPPSLRELPSRMPTQP